MASSQEWPRVLVAEEETHHNALGDVLARAGFRCEIALSAETAVARLETDQPYQAFVVGISLNGNKLTGWDAARRARELDPAIGLIYTGAGAADHWPVRGVPNSIVLRRPFAQAQLITALATVISLRGRP